MATTHWRTTRAAQSFISRCEAIHDKHYSYEQTEYIDSVTPVKIFCPIHGTFAQRPADHLRGKGCPSCGMVKIITASRRQADVAADNFITKAMTIHGNNYSYHRVQYKTARAKVAICCPQHGEFQQTPNDHLCGKGCPKCGKILQGTLKRVTATRDALTKAKLLHGNKYSYDHIADDHGVCDSVILHCPLHGEFHQELRHHKVRGCPTCGHEHGPGWYSKTRLKQTGQDTIPVIAYVCRVFNDTEEFVKIGITKQTVRDRFEELSKYYHWEIIEEQTMPATDAVSLEKKLKRQLKSHRYIPIKRFGGYTECYAPTICINSSILSSLEVSRTDQ